MKRFTILIIAVSLLSSGIARSQETTKLTLQQVLKLAEEQSPDAILAKHRFRASYWQYRSFKAEYLPALTLSGNLPSYNRAYQLRYNSQTNTDSYILSNSNSISGAVSLEQNIGLTGGNIFVRSDLERYDDLSEEGYKQFISTPVSIGITQPIFRFNELKWQKRIEPLRYEAAKKTFLEDVENVHLRAVQRFFQLALAQINKEIAVMNYANADTLYRIAQGRYNLGTIAENELLQMELSFLNAGTSLNNANINLRDMELRLRSFLGYNENINIELIIPSKVPDFEINTDKCLELATANNPEILNYQRQLIEASRNVAQAKAEKGLNANMNLSYGLTGKDGMSGADGILPNAYTKLSDQQRASISFTLPIVDWGMRRGRYRMAQSSEELTKIQVQQSIIDFQQNLFLDVAQFNQQDDQVRISAKSDTVAAKMFEVTKQRFLIGNVDVLDLNNADTRKDENRRGYIQALQNYWTFYYNLRGVALYDFENDKPLSADFESLIIE